MWRSAMNVNYLTVQARSLYRNRRFVHFFPGFGVLTIHVVVDELLHNISPDLDLSETIYFHNHGTDLTPKFESSVLVADTM